MPTRPASICGCGQRVASGQTCACRKRQRAEQDAARPSAAARGYDAAWRRVRSLFLKAHPTCAKPGCDRPATDADHVVSVRERPDLRLSWSNLRPFCHAHHSQRTARDQGFARGRSSQTPAAPSKGGRVETSRSGRGDRDGSVTRDTREIALVLETGK